MSNSKFITVEEMFLDEYFLSLFSEDSINSYRKYNKLQTSVKAAVVKELKTVYEKVEYIPGKRYVRKASFVLDGKRVKRIAKETNYSNCSRPSGSQQLYKALSIEFLEGMISTLDGYHTWYDVLYQLELFHKKSDKVSNGKKYLESLIRKTLERNKKYFYSYQPFQLFYKVFNKQYMNNVWQTAKPELVAHFLDEIVKIRSNEVFKKWMEQTKANYETVFIANVKGINSPRERFSMNTVHIKEEELLEYSNWYASAKNKKIPNEEITKLSREKFGFNHAYAMYRFFDNDHLPVLENPDELRQQIRDNLMSVLVKLSTIRNHTKQNSDNKKEEVPTYDEKFSLEYDEDKWSLSFLAERMARDNWFYRLKRSREYLKVAHKVFGDVLEPKDSLRISTTKLKAEPVGLPEYFSIYHAKFSVSEEEKPIPIKTGNTTFIGAKHRRPEVTPNELFNTIKEIFQVDKIPYEWKSMVAILRNGDGIFSESMYSNMGWLPEYIKSPDTNLYAGKAEGYSYEAIQRAFIDCKDDIQFAMKSKDFKDDIVMFRYCIELVIDSVSWAECMKPRKRIAEEVVEAQTIYLVPDELKSDGLSEYRNITKKKKEPRFFDEL